MFWTKFNESTRTLLYSVTCLSIVALVLWFGASLNTTTASTEKADNVVPAAVFPANSGTLGPIPDNMPLNPRNVTFTVSGITGAPSNVEVSHTYGGTIHSWVGDLNVTLIAPDMTSFIIYGRTGQTGANAGDSSDLSGPYNFKDSAVGTNWWAEAFARLGTEVLTPGDYRTTAAGPQPVNNNSPATNLSAAFAGVANPNGTWTLRFADNAGGDTGSVSAASLTIDGAGIPRKVNADFTGDNKTDFSMVRNTTPGLQGDNEFYRLESVREKLRYLAEKPAGNPDNLAPGSNLTWFVNDSAAPASHTIVAFGEPTTDFVVPSDYDGDGKADIAIWRTGPPNTAAFYILQSSTQTVRTDVFGQTGDDPAITGDYDGDGTSDVATFRCPPIGSPGQCFFFYRGSAGMGNITYVPFGFGVQFDYFVNPGDFDGDGKFDFCLQRTAPSGAPAGQFVLLKSGGGTEFITWGRNDDLIVPGDYDGDGKYDFMVSRTENGVRSYYLLTRTGGGTGASPIRWGLAGDVRAPGDYDGDGKTDVAIWRPSATPSTSTYYVRRSSDGMLQQYQYGNQGDGAVPAWIVH